MKKAKVQRYFPFTSFLNTSTIKTTETIKLAAKPTIIKILPHSNGIPKRMNDIDYINAHGTATGNNDLSEGRAIIRVFGNNVPYFSSTKAYTGHTLAAAGAIEAVFSILALQHNVIFPNLNFKSQMKEFNITPQLQLKEKELQTVMSNSFGFGGNCSTVIFSKEQ